MEEQPDPAGAPASSTGTQPPGRVARSLARLDGRLRHLPGTVRRFPGVLALVAVVGVAAVVVAAIAFDWSGVMPLVGVAGTLAGVWIGQRLSAGQAREQALRTEERLLAERRANFQVRTLREISEELERLRDAARDVLDLDYDIRAETDHSRTPDLYRQRNAAQRSYGRVERRVRVLRTRLADDAVVAALNALIRYCREVVETRPEERTEGAKLGIIPKDRQYPAYNIDPAFNEATAVIGKVLRDLGE